MAKILCSIYFMITVCFTGHSVEAGECCTSYQDFYGTEHGEQWCEDYCCYEFSLSNLGEHECCSSLFRRVDSLYRDYSCSSSYWWSTHVYVPVLVAVGCLVAIGVTIVVFIKVFAGPSTRRVGVVHQPPQSQVAVVMAGQSGASMYATQQQGTTYPPTYNSGPPPPPQQGSIYPPAFNSGPPPPPKY